MNKGGGQPNLRGVNAQSVAALSLFLQHINATDFSHIHLEAPEFQDFNLVFKNGKKIICESKERKKSFSYSQLREVLENIYEVFNIENDDEILIICKSADKKLISDITMIDYIDSIKNKLIRKKYTEGIIPLISKTKFWIIPASYNEEAIYSLFSELIGFWLPQIEIRRIVNDFLIEKIYRGSAIGAVYTREDFLNELTQLANEVKKNSVYYNQEFNTYEEQFIEIEKALNNPHAPSLKITKELSALSGDPNLMQFVIDRLKTKIMDLEKWDNLWQINNIPYFAHWLFIIFANNLHTEENRKYVLNYCKQNLRKIRSYYYRFDSFFADTINIVSNILKINHGDEYLNDAFSMMQIIIEFDNEKFFYLRNKQMENKEWEKEKICSLLQLIYKYAGKDLKQHVIEIIFEKFNLTQDDGEDTFYVPKAIFEILYDWINEDFENRFSLVTRKLTKQYDELYKTFGSKHDFNGWESFGAFQSSCNGQYKVHDRHFLKFTLIPAIDKFYSKNKVLGWKFIKEKCITCTGDVNINKPDFLNRAVYKIVLSRYSDDDRSISDESFSILEEFILSKKGIPHKSDLIFQDVVISDMADTKKWRLVELTINKYNLPLNIFLEKATSDLARNGCENAKNILKKWFNNPEYVSGWNRNYISTINGFLDTDPSFSIELLNILISSDDVKLGEERNFSIATLLRELLKRDYEQGCSILRLLEAHEHLSKAQQIVYVASLFNTQGGDESDDPELLIKLYNDIVDPFFKKHKYENSKISQRITDPYARELLVQFASRLVSNKRIDEALKIINVFINDIDPAIQSQTILDGEEPRTITSVRGWCGWVLMRCAGIEGRNHLPEIINLTNQLISDENYYVVHMATRSLAHIANNRLKVMPNNENELFLSVSKETALKMAKEIEHIAFNFLDRYAKWNKSIQIALRHDIAQVFGSIRALNEKDALKALNIFIEFPNEVIAEVIPMFFYFAELRKNDFLNWKFVASGLYDDLGSDIYDDNKFRNIFIKVIEMLHKEYPRGCLKLISSIEYIIRNTNEYDRLAINYFNLLIGSYNNDIFNSIYQTIHNKLDRNNDCSQQWNDLFIKCLKIENVFYNEEYKKGNAFRLSWNTNLYHSKILVLLYDKNGEVIFIEAAKIFFSFPKGIMLRESEQLLCIIENLAKNMETKNTMIEIAKNIYERNPSKYFDWYSKIKA